jgi:hypothetical protein
MEGVLKMSRYIILAVMCLMPVEVMASEPPSALELLNKYGETLDKYRSYILKSDTIVQIKNKFTGRSRMHPQYLSGGYYTNYIEEIRYDGEYLKWIRSRWGDLYREKLNVPKSDHHYNSWFWDGRDTYDYGHIDGNRATIGSLKLHQNKLPWEQAQDFLYQAHLSRGYHGGCLMGHLYGDDERIDQILRAEREISMRDEMENINGSNFM